MRVFFEASSGIIPAYAGSTAASTPPTRSRWDHPRIRGEHPHGVQLRVGVLGSSPHTRGALQKDLLARAQRGIIPAYAGSTNPRAYERMPHRDHPRIRGEHNSYRAVCGECLGSSPHTRGARRGLGAQPSITGIIPAYAGSTIRGMEFAENSRDHPRIRGEHFFNKGTFLFDKGSSPHTRGALAEFGQVECRRGIIPAYAGSTVLGFRRIDSRRDHPRIRGEHLTSRCAGSS